MKTTPIIENKQFINKLNKSKEIKKPFIDWIKHLQIKKQTKLKFQPCLKCEKCNGDIIVKFKQYTNIREIYKFINTNNSIQTFDKLKEFETKLIDYLECIKCGYKFVIKT